MIWGYGVTTVPSRFETTLPQTLDSLVKAGFKTPRLFVDSDKKRHIVDWELGNMAWFRDHEYTLHCPPVRAFGNWVLAAWELYIRQPCADRYAIFQDDMVTYRNLKQFLETIPYPDNGYCNLSTWPVFEQPESGWHPSEQQGKSAVALMFDNAALRTLLGQEHFINRVLDTRKGHMSIDGGVVIAMNKAGYKEFLYNTSLTYHTGTKSTLGHFGYPNMTSFKGEEYNAMDLLK